MTSNARRDGRKGGREEKSILLGGVGNKYKGVVGGGESPCDKSVVEMLEPHAGISKIPISIQNYMK